MSRSPLVLSLVACSLTLGLASVAAAQTAQPVPGLEATVQVEPAFTAGGMFLEVNGDFGFQFGNQPYVPNGTMTTTMHPLTNGPGVGATAGYALRHDIELLADYSHGWADSRNGSVDHALTSVDGAIQYDTIAIGGRLGRHLGPGRLYGQLGVGVVLPADTKVTYQYAPQLAPLGISGTGTETEHYNLGVGAHAEFGYHVELASGMYLGASVRLQEYQTSNDGNTTAYDNFVADFSHPVPITTEIDHGTTSAMTPTTYSIQDARVHLALGYQF